MYERHEPVTVNAYDLLPDEDSKAIAWVREQGGLDEVEKRLMPDGVEWLLEVWPRWSNGEYCKFGDWWMSDKYGDSEPKQFLRLSIYTPEQLDEWGQGDGESYGYEWGFVRPSDPKYRPDKVEPPAPKVLDADGVEIRAGDEVYIASCGDGPWTVTKITTAHAWHVYGHSDELGSLDMQPNLLTHRAPVLAADGKPLEAGQTVYAKNYGYVKCTVLAIEWVVDGYLVEVENEGGHKFSQTPDEFTHERPDSWERLEHDAEKTVCEYFGANYDCANCPLESAKCAEEVKKDIIRRAKKLAEREQ